MTRYKKLPVEIDAVQWLGTNLQEVAEFLEATVVEGVEDPDVKHIPSSHELVIPTLEGDHRAGSGDWIIRGVKGELYPCKPDIFEATYETVPEPETTDAPDRTGDIATADEPPAQVSLSGAEAVPEPTTCPHAWAAADNVTTISCTLEPGHEGAHVGAGGEAPPA